MPFIYIKRGGDNMGSFNALDFVFDDISSHTYGLRIYNFGDSSPFHGTGSSDVNIISQRVLRKAKPYFLGRSQEPSLEFELTFGTENSISGMDRDIISAWLFGRAEYKKLYIIQPDLNGAYFNCFMTKPQPIYIGNLNYAFSCTVVCDSPFAYSPLKTVSGSFTGGGVVDHDVDVYNYSSDDDYLYPIITFGLNAVGDSFSLTNITDSSREFLFEDLQPNEEITVDNDLQTITSSTGDLRLSNFNKNWLRFLPKKNSLNISSGIGTFEITYRERWKIGG